MVRRARLVAEANDRGEALDPVRLPHDPPRGIASTKVAHRAASDMSAGLDPAAVWTEMLREFDLRVGLV